MIATTTTLSLGVVTNGEGQERESLRLAVTAEKAVCNGTRHQTVGDCLTATRLSIRVMESKPTGLGMPLVMQLETKTLTHQKVFSGGEDEDSICSHRILCLCPLDFGSDAHWSFCFDL